MAYMFTPSAKGIIERMKAAAERGVKIKIIINHLESQNIKVQNKLQRIQAEHSPHFLIYNFSERTDRQLHAKVVVKDREKVVIGSSNFSQVGSVINYEIGVLIRREAAWDAAQLIDAFANSLCVRINICQCLQYLHDINATIKNLF